MAESQNIATMAERLSKELFAEFLWTRVGPANVNWPCPDNSVHQMATHPSDVVFYYDEPYFQTRTYVTCDLKSYAKGTIGAATIRNSIERLSAAHACADKSDDFRSKFVHNHTSFEICSLLFVYNHDGAYDSDFSKIIDDVNLDKLEVPKDSKLVVLGPKDIHWLNNVRLDIQTLRGQGSLPSRDKCRFFYPHLVRRKNVQPEKARAATLEMLTAPWIIFTYEHPDDESRRGYLVYYRRPGETVEEFLYLIDYLLHYQAVFKNTDVRVRMLSPHVNAPAHFAKAIDEYIESCGGGEEVRILLKSVACTTMTNIATVFSEIEIGMDVR
ncbi:hypothetical protein [Dyella silvatica]|uniref:hypothetical protein n=1 Tax=Dyella silvatica TaxID=2992128 RepID=UPI00224CD75E|nr:hypothetical protein [Dyella silvatica]